MTTRETKICPLLQDPKTYNPDTLDLLTDENARNYWLPCLENMVSKFVSKASVLNPDDPNAMEHAESCYQAFHDLVEKIRLDPMTLNPLSVRTLLEFNEDTVRSHFTDAWYTQKENETAQALAELQHRLSEIDRISDFDQKWVELVRGALAGNFFDWGSRLVQDILENEKHFGLDQALRLIEPRPWFMDNLDLWIKRLRNRPYKKAVVFVDNAGVDFILGMLPLARELLKLGTKVVITANTSPSLNDVTFKELKVYCEEAARYDDVIKKALANGHLVPVDNGQKGPCLDLMALSSNLCDLISNCDLIILEGMGRAVHTNLHAKFNVDSVKMAVLKNKWLAESLGAKKNFAVILTFEPAPAT